MSFSFSFAGDDIEEDNADTNLNTTNSHHAASRLATQLDRTNIDSTPLIKPKSHTLANLLESLPDQLSYNLLEIPFSSHETSQNGVRSTKIPRRALFDIRQQLMHEVDPAESGDQNPTSNLLSGLETGDLSTGIYEGGFKTWECAVDLASLLLSNPISDTHSRPLHVIELGAGSAIPSLVLLKSALQRRGNWSVRFTLCDYNEDVLRLCTAVNIFMTVASSEQNVDAAEGDEGELDVQEELVAKMPQALRDQGIEIDFVSGAWGDEFIELLKLRPEEQVLVLASETIYSPSSLEVFTKTVLDIVRRSNESRVLVAAKKVYFGVGGGVQEFLDVVHRQGGSVRSVLDVPGAGVGRVVLEVSGRHEQM